MLSVLLIDDDGARASGLVAALSGEDYECRIAPARSEACAQAAELRPDLVALGLGPHVDDTLALCRQLTSHPTLSGVPVLIVGEADLEEAAIRCLDAGASDWLAVPLAPALVRARIRASVRARLDGGTAPGLPGGLGQHDSVTRLPTRQLFDEFASRAIGFAKRHGQSLAVLSLDLDHFSQVNDSLSHSVGDRLLRSVAARVKGCVRGSDLVARLGGDELTVLLLNLSDANDAALVAEKIVASISKPHLISGHELFITPSMGIAVYPDHGQTHEDLIRHANLALNEVKQRGRNAYSFFTPSMRRSAVGRLHLEQHLREALQREQFALYYQPQCDARKGLLIGAEGLLRWIHPELGIVPTPEVIRAAESSGLIGSIGEWVLREACAQKRRWESEGRGEFPVSVNVSFQQLREGSFAAKVAAILEESGLQPSHLDLEITENTIMDDVETARASLNVLREMGVLISIDDFGTGYSSLSVLGKFPADRLKIDRAFVRDVAHDRTQAAITRTVIAIAKELGLDTIAEGVETEEQMEFLASLGCERMQGYLFGRPVDAEEFERQWGESLESPVKLREP